MTNTPGTIWDISDSDFTKYVAESFFYNEIARKCGYKCCTNYRIIKRRIDIIKREQMKLGLECNPTDFIFANPSTVGALTRT